MTHGVLVIEDEATLARNIARYLGRMEFDMRIAATLREGWAAYEEFRPDIVLLDLSLPDGNGLDLLKRMRAQDPQAKVIILTGHGSISTAVEAMRLGATDFLTKPVALGELHLLVDRVLNEGRVQGALAYYQGRDARGSGVRAILGDSKPVEALRTEITRLVAAERGLPAGEAPPAILVRGETGSGKELVARALHFDGARAAQPFIELNCSVLPAQLVEAELFGHERGAFTDARERRLGLIEAAHGGTLFLDEIGELDPPVQAKLLKVLEDRTVRRIGAVRERQVDVRFIAATHRPLEALVREGRFRADLYYRLSVVTVAVPPLSERGEDVLLLARHFLAQQARRYGRRDLVLGEDACAALLRHRWPGNVRELRNMVEQAVVSSGAEGVLRGAHFALARFEEPAPVAGDQTLPEMERDSLVRALDRAAGNVSRAARVLGISRDTMRYRMNKHGLDSPRVEGDA